MSYWLLVCVGRFEDEFVNQRLRQLQAWVDRMCNHPVVAHSDVFQHFLTCTDDKVTTRRLSHGDCLEVKREYYQNCSMLGCVTQCSQSAAHLCEQFLQVEQIDLSDWDPYIVHRGGCLELYYCNMVEWFWWDSRLIFDDQLVSFSALTLLVWSSGL